MTCVNQETGRVRLDFSSVICLFWNALFGIMCFPLCAKRIITTGNLTHALATLYPLSDYEGVRLLHLYIHMHIFTNDQTCTPIPSPHMSAHANPHSWWCAFVHNFTHGSTHAQLHPRSTHMHTLTPQPTLMGVRLCATSCPLHGSPQRTLMGCSCAFVCHQAAHFIFMDLEGKRLKMLLPLSKMPLFPVL